MNYEIVRETRTMVGTIIIYLCSSRWKRGQVEWTNLGWLLIIKPCSQD